MRSSPLIIDFAEYRERHRVRQWFAMWARECIAPVVTTFAADCAKLESLKRRIAPDEKLTVPWKRCALHAFIFLYGSRCPMCLADAYVPYLQHTS